MGYLRWLPTSALTLFSIYGCGPYPTHGIEPIHPKVLTSYQDSSKQAYTSVESIRPTFVWNTYRSFIGWDNNGHMDMIRDLEYELKIWKVNNNMPISLAYSVTGIKETHHQIGVKLVECQRYMWTVRARFKLNGNFRVSEWGIVVPSTVVDQETGEQFDGLKVLRYPLVPSPFHYRFMTPC